MTLFINKKRQESERRMTKFRLSIIDYAEKEWLSQEEYFHVLAWELFRESENNLPSLLVNAPK